MSRDMKKKIGAVDDPPPHIDADFPRAKGSNGAEARRGSKPSIRIGTDESRVVDEAVAALSADSSVFQRDGRLVRVVDDGAVLPKIQTLPRPSLRELLATAADFLTYDSGTKRRDAAWKEVHPPEWVVLEVEARGSWPGVRRLTSVITAPTMRPNGTILDVPGYDEATGVLYRPRARFPRVVEAPTAGHVRAAMAVLADPLADFPWAGPHDRAAAIAAIMTIVVRAALDGPVPMFPIKARAAGTGKGLLADVLSIAASGRAPRLIASPPAQNDEWRKVLLSIALESPAVVSIDNVDGELGAPALAAALTTGSIYDRLLGVNEMGGGDIRAVFFATGNNISLTQTIARRAVVIDLEVEAEHPEDRVGWKHERLREHVEATWPTLAIAALTIARAFVTAGRPRHTRPRLGSYEAWDDLVRSACIWSGVGDPDGARQRTRDEADGDRDALGTALAVWRRAFGPIAKSTAELAAESEKNTDLAAAFAGICRGGKVTARALGYTLRAVRRKIVGGLRADSRRGDTGNTWLVEEVRPAPGPCEPCDPCDRSGYPTSEEIQNPVRSEGPEASHGSHGSPGNGGQPGVPATPAAAEAHWSDAALADLDDVARWAPAKPAGTAARRNGGAM